MCHTLRYIQHFAIFRRKLTGMEVTIGSRTMAQVHNHIKNPALNAIDQFCMVRGRQLKMQSAQHMLLGDRVILLNKISLQPQLLKGILVNSLNKCSPAVTAAAGYDFITSRQWSI